MGKINRLNEHISNMIAAGEVVERPMGIVKELVENSIDAGAAQIEIQAAQGGIDTITIIDDGCGMDGADALLAFERHATSKLKEENDLWNIHTMGFRGEALPSIAAVSHVLMRTNNGEESTEVEIRYGELDHAVPVGTPRGTMIQIQHLFQKTPARFKHLKSPQYEFSLISDVVQKFALSHPDIAFLLSHDGRTVFKTKGNGNLLEVLMQIYGREAAKTAMHIQSKDMDYEVCGYAIQPSYNRATKYYMLLYINGRMIRNYRLQKAVIDAYCSYMPKDRYPIVVLDIKMDAQLVDVNVHPSKWEIRLSKEKQLERLLYDTITQALKEQFQVSEVKVKKEKEKIEIQSMDFTYQRDDQVSKLHAEINDSFVHPEKLEELDMEELRRKIEPGKLPSQSRIIPKHAQHNDKYEETNTSKTYECIDQKSVAIDKPKDEKTSETIRKTAISLNDSSITQQEDSYIKEPSSTYAVKLEPTQEQLEYSTNDIKEETPSVNQSLPQMEVIGQFHNCYILAQGEEGLYIIDQHAAQERYHYEQIQKLILSGSNDMQLMLVPVTIDTSMSAVSQLDDLNQCLSQLGIELEAFGSHSLVCRSLPIWMSHVDEKAFLEDMIDFWIKDQEVSLEKLRKHAIATMACHSSIRFNRSLNLEEMKQVVKDLSRCEQPFHCPHGRPTLICLSDQHLYKEFQRGG